jgi:ParB family transcriptional regulator, chromosome partitioning protein
MSQNPSNKKEALNRGIRSLLGSIDTEMKSPLGNLASPTAPESAQPTRVAIEDIIPNPKQPRQDFNQKSLEELALSIQQHDIIQPLTVKKLPNGKYRLIAGERRWRAAQLAKLNNVPVYIREANDQQVLELALLENLQREDLNAIEIGLSYQRLMDDCALTQDQVAARMGIDRSTVSNYIRMLKLPPDIIVAVRNGSLSMGHARALINVGEVDKQLFVYHAIVSKKLSVRQTEEMVKNLYRSKKTTATPPAKSNDPYKRIESQLSSHFGTKARLDHHKSGHGKISFEYYSLEELNGLLEKMNVRIQ